MQVKLVNENFQKDYGKNLLKARGVTDLEEFLNPTKECLTHPRRSSVHAHPRIL